MTGIRTSTLERRQRVLAMRQEGLSNAEIGRSLGVSRQCIEQLIHRDRMNAYHREWKRRRLTAAQLQAPARSAG